MIQKTMKFDLDGLSEDFDGPKSESLKKRGMSSAAAANSEPLALARSIAVELCHRHGETDADAVGRLLRQRHGIETLGPSAGSIFKSGFEFTGKRRRSERKKNHAREIKIWRLKT